MELYSPVVMLADSDLETGLSWVRVPFVALSVPS